MIDWPQDRPSPLTNVCGLAEFRHAWSFSAERISALRGLLIQQTLPSQVASIAVSGSLARMEAHERSDVDLLIVVDDRESPVSAAEMAGIYQIVWNRLADSLPDAQLTPPKPGGVFSACASWRQMTDESARGIVNENMTTYGQRMQILLDAQPLYLNRRFSELQQELLKWYSEERITAQFNEAGPFHWLRLEVLRYWYSIQARACWLFADKPTNSLEVNVKLRSSRKLLFTAFLRSLDQSQTSVNPVEQMLELRRLTPIETITRTMASPADIASCIQSYETAWKFCQSIDTSAIPSEVSDALARIGQYVTGN